MTESESVALPLGDAPIFSTVYIIADEEGFVKPFFQNLFFFSKIPEKSCAAIDRFPRFPLYYVNFFRFFACAARGDLIHYAPVRHPAGSRGRRVGL